MTSLISRCLLPSGPDQDKHLKGTEGGGEEDKIAAVGVVRKGLLEMTLEQDLRVGGTSEEGVGGAARHVRGPTGRPHGWRRASRHRLRGTWLERRRQQ